MQTENPKGPILAIIIIIVLLVAGGAFVLNNRLNQDTSDQTLNQVDQQTASLQTQSTSTKTTDIESDVKNTDLNNLDAELQSVGEELKK